MNTAATPELRQQLVAKFAEIIPADATEAALLKALGDPNDPLWIAIRNRFGRQSTNGLPEGITQKFERARMGGHHPLPRFMDTLWVEGDLQLAFNPINEGQVAIVCWGEDESRPSPALDGTKIVVNGEVIGVFRKSGCLVPFSRILKGFELKDSQGRTLNTRWEQCEMSLPALSA